MTPKREIKKVVPNLERVPNLYKYLCSIILIFGMVVVVYISIQNDDISFNIKNIKIDNADNHTKRIIFRILNQTDQHVVRHISSINIVSEIPCEDASGCTIGNFTSEGILIESDIYLLDVDAYKDSCDTFEHSLYHELGHIVYFYKYGNSDTKKEDDIYQELIELYAVKYANNHSAIQKEGCNREVIGQLKRDFKEKEKIYEYAIKIMSKWDRYRDDIPSEMRDEYKHDYSLYEDVKKDYNVALNRYKDYMIKVQSSTLR